MFYPVGLSRLKTQAIIACGVIGVWHSVQGQITASNDFYIATEGTALTVSAPGVLTNDTGGGQLTATLVSGPANGTLSLNANGSFTYTPTNNFTGVDGFTYQASSGLQVSGLAAVVIMVVAPGELFYDNFARPTISGAVFPWSPVSDTSGPLPVLGTWGITNSLLIGHSPSYSYGYIYFNTNWTDYSVQAQIRFAANNASSAAIFGRLNAAVGAQYSVWIYPEESPEGLASGNGTAILRFIKCQTWSTYTVIGDPVILPGVGVDWHTVKLTFQGSNISVYFDGILALSVTDDGSLDGNPAFTSGGIGLSMWTLPPAAYAYSVDNLIVSTSNSIANYDTYRAITNTTLRVAAPGILANDAGNAPLTATLVGGPTYGSLTLTNNGGFSYTPTGGFSGTDLFTYQCSDGQTTSQVATVTLTVNNAALANNDAYTVLSNTTLNVGPPGVLANDQGGTGPLTAILNSGPADGSLTLTNNGGFRYTPTNGFIGLDSFTYQCRNSQSTSQVATAIINVVASIPVPPSLSFDLTNNSSVSNSALIVTGTTTGGMTVTNVFYQLNGAGWNAAQTTNGWTNWTANVILSPGTNVIQAFAVDSIGDVSPTNRVNLVCILSAVLTVQTNGNGSINPNYNGALLQIGKNYSMTATAASGFAFVNWTGSITTNGATLQFTMASNLTFTANFADATRPALGITNITAGMLVSNASFTVMGTATDNVAVASVYWSLSNAVVNSSFAPATTANNWANWSTNLTLTPGTNTVRAYAVDTSGNLSTTNSATLVYILSATLTVSTNGLGSLNPNDNGALLQIGKNYSITATAGTGFAFTNWMGGTNLPLTLITNGTTVTFSMVSNLMLQANFVDTSKPTVSITNLTAGMNVSNASFTVRGKAGDNVAVSNVFYSLNNTGWSNAVTGNGWTNWTAAVTLMPGTNIVAAYAADTAGNKSTTNTLNFFYVVNTILTVGTNGLGSLNPNDNGMLLQIGKGYSITASPGSGFMFTNWTGGTNLSLTLLTNGATVQFLMQSNLTLQANFVDVTKPTVSITNLTSGQRLSNNAAFTVKGTASDNWMVSNVWCQIDGLGWNAATNINHWTNWAAGVTLIPGTNVVQAYAVDTTGNLSTTNTVSFQYVVTNRLGVRALGLGTISPNYSNAWLEIGRNYSMAATPASGFNFTNWVISTNWLGGTMTNRATVLFMMESNLTLQVSFVDVTRPTVTITAPTAGQHMTNALATVVGTASDNWGVTNVWYQFNSNAWSLATSTNGWTNWTVTLTLAAGTNTVKAYAVDLGANLSTTNNVSFVSSNAFKLQLAFTTVQPLATNGLNFALQVSTGLNGHVQVSTDLVNWVALTNFIGTNSTIDFRDATATNYNQRFYRAVSP